MIRAAALALALAGPAAADTFVLVHGAFVGEWAWDGVAAQLEGAGHTVIRAHLTGLGSRADELAPTITIADHIADVVAAIDTATEPVILVGHSWGTRPVVGAWDAARDRVAHVVLIEGLGPLRDHPDVGVIADDATRARLIVAMPEVAESGLLPAPPQSGTTDPRTDVIPTLHRRYTDMPVSVLYDAVPLTRGPLPDDTPGTYIAGQGSPLAILARYGQMLHDWRGWDVHLIPGGHNLPETNANDLAAILIQISD